MPAKHWVIKGILQSAVQYNNGCYSEKMHTSIHCTPLYINTKHAFSWKIVYILYMYFFLFIQFVLNGLL